MSVLERCSSYRESTKRSKDRQRPPLSVTFTETEIPVSLFRESWPYVQSNPALQIPAKYRHLIITDCFLCSRGKPLHFLTWAPAVNVDNRNLFFLQSTDSYKKSTLLMRTLHYTCKLCTVVRPFLLEGIQTFSWQHLDILSTVKKI